jgi:geranylgeranyl reductase family protein
MQAFDVIVVGGGPAGSTCAWRLRQAGLEVLVIDKAEFPRDKVCAGWITPPVLDALRLDPAEYAASRTFEPITRFRVGTIGQRRAVDVDCASPVSFAIRRTEFDAYLLKRSGATAATGVPVTSLRRDDAAWIVNERFTTSMLVGAGGHFCPVARRVDRTHGSGPVVAAQEVEVQIDGSCPEVAADRPELYFSPDLAGYGWCLRKGRFLNVGLGRVDGRALPSAVGRFVRFLRQIGRLPTESATWKWRGHAYAVGAAARATLAGDGFVLAGDAAGLARPMSGEGIRPAVVSGLLAADAIVRANGRYTADALAPYAVAVRDRFGAGRLSRLFTTLVPSGMAARAAIRLLEHPWFVRRVVIDRWFLDAA